MATTPIAHSLKSRCADSRALRKIFFGFVLALTGISAVMQFHAARAADNDDTLSSQTEQSALRDLVLSSTGDAAVPPVRGDVVAFYDKRDFEPVWTGSGAAEEMGARVRLVIEHADEQGLRESDYLPGISQWDSPPSGTIEAARYDLALTDALFHYASDVRSGRFASGGVYKDVRLPRQPFDVGAALGKALKNRAVDALIASLPPPLLGYQRLVATLAHYRAVEALGGWPTIPARSEIVFTGKDVRARTIVRRLEFDDPILAANLDPSAIDVEEAISRFQDLNGLPVDGRAGIATLKQLNVPVSFRIKQIIANMERWRWMPRSMESRYIRVNVPDQSLDFILDGKVALHSAVIIGKKTSPTPILRMEVSGIVSNPAWDIPDDIAARKILPHLRKSPNYLASRDMTLVDGPAGDPQGIEVNWRQVQGDRLPYQLRQKPGPDNVLGVLMLDSPNDFDVYMHDTPNKKLFASDMREASNGCVRVEQIFPLASLALTNDAEDGLDRLNDAVASGETQTLALNRPLPVYLLYWTAIAGPNGTVGFRPDRYGRDAILLAKLARKPSTSAHS
jgi:murein L,D-transpeptidase YcbB/YkuD